MSAHFTETIDWYVASEVQPDDELLVLINAPGASEPVWPGYLDGDQWRWANGALVEQDVVGWAAIPVGFTKSGRDRKGFIQ